MKINQNNVKTAKASNQRSVSRQAIIILIVVLAVAATILINVILNKENRQVVEVLVFKENVEQGTYITEEMFTTKEMLLAEYNKEAEVKIGGETRRSIILADEKNILVNANLYADYYMRANTALYWDSFTTIPTKKNSYLYEMDGELIKLDVSADVFGDMVVPGDKVNIRCLYTEQTYKIPTAAEYEAMSQLGLETTTSEEKLILLFSEVAILDMLNSSGESIFDYYYEYLTWPVSKQKAALEDDTFKKNTAPSQILLSVTAEEADNYMRIQNKGPQYMLTLLPRDGSNLILDALTEITSTNGGLIDKNVESAITSKKDEE